MQICAVAKELADWFIHAGGAQGSVTTVESCWMSADKRTSSVCTFRHLKSVPLHPLPSVVITHHHDFVHGKRTMFIEGFFRAHAFRNTEHYEKRAFRVAHCHPYSAIFSATFAGKTPRDILDKMAYIFFAWRNAMSCYV